MASWKQVDAGCAPTRACQICSPSVQSNSLRRKAISSTVRSVGCVVWKAPCAKDTRGWLVSTPTPGRKLLAQQSCRAAGAMRAGAPRKHSLRCTELMRPPHLAASRPQPRTSPSGHACSLQPALKSVEFQPLEPTAGGPLAGGGVEELKTAESPTRPHDGGLSPSRPGTRTMLPHSYMSETRRMLSNVLWSESNMLSMNVFEKRVSR